MLLKRLLKHLTKPHSILEVRSLHQSTFHLQKQPISHQPQKTPIMTLNQLDPESISSPDSTTPYTPTITSETFTADHLENYDHVQIPYFSQHRKFLTTAHGNRCHKTKQNKTKQKPKKPPK